MILFYLWNFIVNMFVTSQINWVNFVFIYKIQSLKFQIFKFSFIIWWLIKVQNTFFVWLSTKLLNQCWRCKIFYRMLNEIINYIFDFKPCCILKNSVSLFVIKSFYLVSFDSWCTIQLVLCTDNESVFEWHSDSLTHFVIRVLFNNKTLTHACK